MKFFQKRWVAITLCVLMIAASVAIGRARTASDAAKEYQPASTSAAEAWGRDNYGSFTRYIRDDAGLLSEKTIRTLSERNAALDYAYDSICGVAIVDLGIASGKMEDEAFDLGYELGLGESDFFLLLDTKSRDWYFAYGTDAGQYVDHSLEVLLTGAMDEVFDAPEQTLTKLFDNLGDWYGEHMPVSGSKDSGGTIQTLGGTVFFVFLLVILIVVSLISGLIRAGRRMMWRSSGWMPFLFLNNHHHHHHHGPTGPNPNPGPRPRSGGRAGGFGGSSRGNFRGGGGFGGGNRGGGFGGRR